MLGMEMMMKSMGINPDEIKSQLEKVSLVAQEKMLQFEAQLNRIEQNQVLLYQLLVRAKLIETVDEYHANLTAEREQALIPSTGEINGKRKSN